MLCATCSVYTVHGGTRKQTKGSTNMDSTATERTYGGITFLSYGPWMPCMQLPEHINSIVGQDLRSIQAFTTRTIPRDQSAYLLNDGRVAVKGRTSSGTFLTLEIFKNKNEYHRYCNENLCLFDVETGKSRK